MRDRIMAQPGRVVPLAFALVILIGSVLLSLPPMHTDGGFAPFVALFTATSAVCVTGLTVVDTATYWTPLGQGVILLLIQVGGFGIVTLATLLALLVARRLGLRTRLAAASETRSVGLGDVRSVLKRVGAVMLGFEAIIAAILTARWWLGYGEPFLNALWLGVFHAVSAFNNAGFSLLTTNLVDFVSDPWICLPIAAAIIVGGIGFPVLFELRRHYRLPDEWSVHTRLTVWTTVLLLIVGTLSMYLFEWTNPDTLGQYDTGTRLLAGFFQGVQPRTAGFNSLDYGAMREESWIIQSGLMFVGGGSAGTAGGIKVTTFMLLGFVILAEIRGQHDVTIVNRRIAESVQRQALAVALLGVGAVATGTLLLLALSPYPVGQVLFESVSAFGTVGLSTGITASLDPAAQLVLIALMFIGRVGPASAASIFALRERDLLYRYPEARPIVG